MVDAVLLLDDLLPLNMIGIKKVPGGALEVTKNDNLLLLLLLLLLLCFILAGPWICGK